MLPLHKELARLLLLLQPACQLSCATPIFFTFYTFAGEMLPLYEELARLLRLLCCNCGLPAQLCNPNFNTFHRRDAATV